MAEDADAVFGDRPFFLTMTETVGPPATRHVDVSLWFALAGRVGQPLRPDQREFAQVRWWMAANFATRAWTGSSLTCCALWTRSGSAADRQLSALGAR